MGRYLLRRLLNYVILLFIAVTLSYFLAATALNPRALYEVVNPPIDPTAIENELRAKNLSDQIPLIQRWWTWFTSVLQGDWGMAAGPRGGFVNEEIGRRMWVSLRLITIGSLVGMVGGIALGAWTATRQYKAADRAATATSLFFLSMPTLVVATVLSILATVFNQTTGLRVFEFVGETGDHGDYPLAWLADRAQHLLLPSLTLIIFSVASFSRIQRNLMLDALSADFVRTARAKGLPKQKAIMRHALRTAMIPTATFFAFNVATLFTGAAFLELIFTFNGMGIYAVQTILGNDVHGTVAVVAFSGICVLTGAMLSDILVAALDPRVRVG